MPLSDEVYSVMKAANESLTAVEVARRVGNTSWEEVFEILEGEDKYYNVVPRYDREEGEVKGVTLNVEKKEISWDLDMDFV